MTSLAVRAEAPTLRLSIDEIGGGKVEWGFRMGGEYIKRGTFLTPEQIMSINPANRASLLGRFIRVWPKALDSAGKASPASGAGADRAERTAGVLPNARHVVALGFGRYNVIEGTVLTDKPVTRAEAHALAGTPMPEAQDEAAAPPRRRRKRKEH